MRGVAAEFGGLRVEPAAQRDRLVQHRLRRRAPAVHGQLIGAVVPGAARLQALQVVVGEPLPGALAVQRQRRVEQRRLQLQETGHRGHDAARAARRRTARRTRPARCRRCRRRTAPASAPTSRRSACRASRTPRAVARHQPLPGRPGVRAASCARPARPSSARAMPHRLAAGRLARVERRVDDVGQAPRLVLDRPAPVERELDDLVASRPRCSMQVVVDTCRSAPSGSTRAAPASSQASRLSPLTRRQPEPDALAVQPAGCCRGCRAARTPPGASAAAVGGASRERERRAARVPTALRRPTTAGRSAGSRAGASVDQPVERPPARCARWRSS